VSTFKKTALVLIISGLLFAGMVYLLDFEPLDFVRTHFYNPSFVSSVVRENERAAEIVQNHILELQNKFAASLNEQAVKSSFLYNQTAADIYERSRVFGILLESVSGLQAVQFVDSNGARIHYSTSARDLISQSSNSASYRNYTDDSRALPYDDISAGANEKTKYTMDDSGDRIIFSFPFFDSMDVYRGTALFTLSVRALAERLITAGCLNPTDDISVIRLPRGIVFGSPNTSKSVILEKIASVWSAGFQEYVTFDAEDAGVKYALISVKTGSNLFFGRIINDSVFSIPDSMDFIFKLSMFLTLFLTLYFLTNFKPHPVTLVQNRIKTLRTGLFEELYIKKTGQDRAKWILELEQRRDEIRSELKSRLRIRRSLEKKIDEIIDTAWDELLAVMKSGYDIASLEEIVKNRAVKVEKPKAEGPKTVWDELKELEEIDEAEPVEEIEQAEPADEIDEIEEIEEVEEVEAIEDADEIEAALTGARKTAAAEEIESYTEIQISKGLLKAASEILTKIKKEESKASAQVQVRNRKGLLKRAIEILNSKGKASAPAPGRGLLNLAIGFLNSIENKSNENKPKSTGMGLLALASFYKEDLREPAEVAEDNLSVREIEDNPEIDDKPETDDNGQEMLFEMEVVSPFSSMLTSLEDEKENSQSETT
jgi:hypothetical protein